jgi:hypothetical protein
MKIQELVCGNLFKSYYVIETQYGGTSWLSN